MELESLQQESAISLTQVLCFSLGRLERFNLPRILRDFDISVDEVQSNQENLESLLALTPYRLLYLTLPSETTLPLDFFHTVRTHYPLLAIVVHLNNPDQNQLLSMIRAGVSDIVTYGDSDAFVAEQIQKQLNAQTNWKMPAVNQEFYTEEVELLRLALVGDLISGQSHEIKNALTIIMGYLDLLEKSSSDKTTKNIEIFQKLSQTVKRMSNILHHNSRMSSTYITSRDSFDLTESIYSTISFFEPYFLTHNIQFTTEKIPNIKLKEMACLFEQVLYNLISNAIDAVAHLSRGEITLKYQTIGSCFQLMVVDSGNGVPSPLINQLFHTKMTIRQLRRGSGISLTLCSRLLKIIGGSIEYKRIENMTYFIIHYPMG